MVSIDVSVSPCVDFACGPYGSCAELYTGVIHYTSCHCLAGMFLHLTKNPKSLSI